jgi:hypothetical protein
MRGKSVVFSLFTVFIIFQGTAWGTSAVPVSPGGGTEIISQSCPTFSWSSASNAAAYRIEVYEQVTVDVLPHDQMQALSSPILAREIAAPALSWTPSTGECLSRGLNYVWYVQGVDSLGLEQWSEGRTFQIEAAVLTAEQTEAVQQVVEGYLSGDGASTRSDDSEGIVNPDDVGTKESGLSTTDKTKDSFVVQSIYEGSTNTFFGDLAGEGITSGGSGSYNTFLGAQAGRANTSGSSNTFVGREAGKAITTTSNNTFVGDYAGAAATGTKNTFVGKDAGTYSTGHQNTFLGHSAGIASTTGDYNTFVGWNAGYINDGSNNTFVGSSSGYSNTDGRWNTFLGYNSGYHNTNGEGNTFIGQNAGEKNDEGDDNTFVGNYSGNLNTAGINNTFLGRAAGFLNVSGSGNVFLGYHAGYKETTSNKLYIDNCFTGYTFPTGGNCTQPLIYGEFDNRVVRIDGILELVSIATPSDIRYKKEIHPLESSLEKVTKLQGVTYEWDVDKVNGAGYIEGKQIGLIAQEVEKVLPELVHKDSKGYKTLSYDKLGPVLVEAVKEQQREIRKQAATISEQKAVIAELKEKLEKAFETIEQRLASLETHANSIALNNN